jgi:hypothetical protein
MKRPAGGPVSTAPSRAVLLAVSFFEGAAAMVVELLGAKIIAPSTERPATLYTQTLNT